MILKALSPEGLSDGFDWNHIEWRWPPGRFCTIQRVDYLYEPFMTMYVNSPESFSRAIHAMEEEALMYMVNELPRGKPAEIKDLIPDNDLIIISNNTANSFSKEMYETCAVPCWQRMFEHDGDLYQDSDLVVRNMALMGSKMPIVVKIDNVYGGQEEFGVANISAAIVQSEVDKLDFPEQTVHLLKRDKKVSTLDMLLGM